MRIGILLLSGLLLCCAISRAGQLDSALRNYMKGEYVNAIQDADGALTIGTPTSEDRARATLIKAQSLEQLGHVDDAVGLYRYLVQAFPSSPQAYQAGEQLRRLGRSPKPH